MIVRTCFVSENCRKDSVSCFSTLQDHIQSHWLDFLHVIRPRIFWVMSLQRISEDFGVRKKGLFGLLAKNYPNGKSIRSLDEGDIIDSK